MNYQTHKELQAAVAKFEKEYKDHPLLKDTVANLRNAMYELDAMLMSPGQKVVASYANPSGQEPSGKNQKGKTVRTPIRASYVKPSGQEPSTTNPIHQ